MSTTTQHSAPPDSPPLSGGIWLNGSAIVVAVSVAAGVVAHLWKEWQTWQRRQAQKLDEADAQQDTLLGALVGDVRAERKKLFERLLEGHDQTVGDIAELRTLVKQLMQQQGETQRIVTSLAILLRQNNAE